MKKLIGKLPAVARVLFGLLFVASGLMGLLGQMPPMEGPGGALMQAMGASGYMLPLIKLTEIAGGALLIVGLAVPLALVLLAPLVVNIAAFHVFLAPEGLPVAIFLVAVQAYLAWTQRAAFAPLFARKARRAPRVAAERAVVPAT